jgi:hypothetical protein
VNGTWVSSGDGGFSANLKLQTTNDGITWTDSPWTVSPSYAYDSSTVTGVTNTFAGTPISVRGVRISGQVHTITNSSYWDNMREVQAFTSGGSPTPTPTPTPTPLPSSSPVPTPPPGSVSCHQYFPGSIIPSGYGVPWDTISGLNELLIKATCNASSVTIDMGKGDPLQYIYRTSYYDHSGLASWTPVTMTSTEALTVSNWYAKTATTNLSLDSTQQAQDTYALGYICTWTGTSWKCGCRDAACTQSYCQIQSFRR